MYGIPNMKLEKSVIERQASRSCRPKALSSAPTWTSAGAVAAEDILNNYDAVVLCCGAKKARDLNVPGRDAKGVYLAVDYLTSVTRSLLDSKFRRRQGHQACIGQECPRHRRRRHRQRLSGYALRQGCTDLVALEMMPQPPAERAASNPWPEWPKVLKVDYGQTECIAKFGKDPRVYQTTVKEFLKDDAGNLTGAVISYLKPERDPETGRTNMVPTGEEFTYDCQLALIAAGFVGCEAYVADAFWRPAHGPWLCGHRPLPHQRAEGLCLRRHAPGPEPCGLGSAGGPRLCRRGRPLPHGLHEPLSHQPYHPLFLS